MKPTRLTAFVLVRPFLFTLILFTQNVFAQSEIEPQTPLTSPQNTVPEKVYIQNTTSGGISHRSENCFYNDEHQHLHCYEDDDRNVQKSESRVVYRTSNRDYRDRDNYNSALSLGLAIAVPLLHDNYRYGAYRSHGYRSYGYRSYRHGYRSHSKSHRRHHRRHHSTHHSSYRGH